jgi:hypothetical protein
MFVNSQSSVLKLFTLCHYKGASSKLKILRLVASKISHVTTYTISRLFIIRHIYEIFANIKLTKMQSTSQIPINNGINTPHR